MGGGLLSHYGPLGISRGCILLLGAWFVWLWFFKPPAHLVAHTLEFQVSSPLYVDRVLKDLHQLPGIVEVAWLSEARFVYFKMQPSVLLEGQLMGLQQQWRELWPEALIKLS